MREVKRKEKELSTKQIELLYLLYKFRIITVTQCARYFRIAPTTAQIRMATIVRGSFIGQRYHSSYRLKGKPASYFLLPRGFNALKRYKELDEAVIKQLYNDPKASDSFVDRQLFIVRTALALRNSYDLSDHEPLTRSELIAYSSLPEYLPEGFFWLGKTGATRLPIFVDVVLAQEPLFVILRKLRSYIAYMESGEWEEMQDFPTLLFICETESLKRHVSRKMRQLLYRQDSELLIGVTSIDLLESTEKRIWLTSEKEAPVKLETLTTEEYEG